MRTLEYKLKSFDSKSLILSISLTVLAECSLCEFAISNRPFRVTIVVCIICSNRANEYLPHKGGQWLLNSIAQGSSQKIKSCFNEVSVNITFFFFSSFLQETCNEFRVLMKNGKLFCSQVKNLQIPDGIMFLKRCAKCKIIL